MKRLSSNLKLVKEEPVIAGVALFAEPDLTQTLSFNREPHVGGKNQLRMTLVPNYVVWSIADLLNFVSDPMPTRSTGFSCAISMGLEKLEQKQGLEVKKLLNLKKSIAIDSELPLESREIIHRLTDHLPLTMPDMAFAGVTQVTIRLSDEVSADLSRLSERIGVSMSMMGIVCTIVTLKGEDKVPKKYRQFMLDSYSGFIEKVRRQHDVVQTIFAETATDYCDITLEESVDLVLELVGKEKHSRMDNSRILLESACRKFLERENT